LQKGGKAATAKPRSPGRHIIARGIALSEGQRLSTRALKAGYIRQPKGKERVGECLLTQGGAVADPCWANLCNPFGVKDLNIE